MDNFYYKEGISFICNSDNGNAISEDIQNLVVDTLVRNSAVGVVSGFYEEGYPIYFISEFALAILGCDIEVLKKENKGNYIELVCPSDRAYYHKIMRIGKGAPDERKYRLINSAGEYIWIKDVKVDYITSDGRRAWLSTIRIIQNEHIAKKNFISTISHDIRTPLNAIIGMAQLAKRNIDNKEKVTEYIDEILTSANQFMYQISEVLDMNDFETMVACLDESVHNVCDIVDSVVKECQDSINVKNQQIITEYIDLHNKEVICDSGNIKKVLKSLISNASIYSPDNSKIRIIVKESESTSADSSVYEFKVKDEGEGIPFYEIDRLFEPFERIQDVRVTKNTLHMGLGLTVTKNIIELMKGTINVESQTGQGSCFTVKLTLKFPDNKLATNNIILNEKQVVSKEVTKNQNATSVNVLIVEDNEKNAEIMQEFLKMEDITSDIAINGLEAVDKFKTYGRKKYDVVLMDIHMPVMDGYEATRIIRKTKEAGGDIVPIIAVTADSLPEDINEAMKCGMNGHISKPVDFNKLVKVIKQQV